MPATSKKCSTARCVMPALCCVQALCFDCEEDMIDALSKDTEQFRGKVVIIR